LFNTFCLLYLSEASPPHLRGAVVAGFQLFLVAGSVLGAVVDNYTAVRVDRLSYQIPLIVLYAVPVLLAFLVLWLPDSPRWLVENGRVEDAKSALQKLQGRDIPETVISQQLAEIDVAIKAEKAMGKVAFLDLFRGTDLVFSLSIHLISETNTFISCCNYVSSWIWRLVHLHLRYVLFCARRIE
jgi:MFS family permease